MASGGGFGNADIDAFDGDLISAWKFDDNANDSIGNYNGTAVGSPSYSATAKDGKSIELDGSTQYVTLADGAFSSHTNGTYSAWIKLDARPGATKTQTFAGASGSGTNLNTISLGIYGEGAADSRIRAFRAREPGNYDDLISDTNIDPTDWFHVVITCDSTSIKAYFNGAEQTLVVDAGSNSGDWFNQTLVGVTKRYTLVVLRYGPTGTTIAGHIDGLVDEICYWSEALDADAVTALWNSGSGRFWTASVSSRKTRYIPLRTRAGTTMFIPKIG